MALCPSLKVFGFAFFKKRMGFGVTPHKNGVFFLQSFFFCAFCAKRKSDVGLEVSLSQEFFRSLFWKKAPQKTFLQKGFWEFSKKVRSIETCSRLSVYFIIELCYWGWGNKILWKIEKKRKIWQKQGQKGLKNAQIQKMRLTTQHFCGIIYLNLRVTHTKNRGGKNGAG